MNKNRIMAAAVLFVLLQYLPRGMPAAPGPVAAAQAPSIADLVGATRLDQTLGPSSPTGRDIAIGHVEGDAGDYLPRIDSDAYRGVDFEIHSGPSQWQPPLRRHRPRDLGGGGLYVWA